MKRSPNRDRALTAREHALLGEARGLILHVAGMLARSYPGYDVDDFVTWCEDGAISAAQDYRDDDPERAAFTTFAWSRIWGAGKNGVQRERRARLLAGDERMASGRASASAYAADQRDTGDPFLDTEEDEARRPREALEGFAAAYLVGFSMGGPPESPETAALCSEIDSAIASLKDRDETIVRQYVIEQKTFAEIAEELPSKPAHATVQKRYHAAMGRLFRRLGRGATP